MWFVKNKKTAEVQNRAELTASDRVLKDEHLSPDFILSAIEDGVVMVGHDNRIHLFNPAASRITGWGGQEALGLDYQNVLSIVDEHGQPCHPEDHPFTKALATSTSVRDSLKWLATRGDKRLPISLIVSPVVDPKSHNVVSVVGVFRDITKEKAEEAQRSEFISTASHEMRTPLTAIEGYLSLALNSKIGKVDANAKKFLDKAVVAVTHLRVLFEDLLTSSKAEDGRLASYPVVIELGEIVEQIVDSARFHAKEKGLELRFAVSGNNAVTGAKELRPQFYTLVDPHRIREVLQNLIDNAIKYTPEGGITVRLTGDQSIAQVQVQDTGPGIAAEDLPHLFQKFYRVDNSLTRTVGGTGLGLFICRKILELYNGRIWAESELGKGSTFFINLPRLNSAQALEMQQKQAATISPLDGH